MDRVVNALTVEVTAKASGGEVTDVAPGKMYGTGAYQQFMHKVTIDVPYEEDDAVVGHTLIPYHAVDHIVVSGEKETVEVDDATCQPVDDENPIQDENGTNLEDENGNTLIYNG